MRIALIVAMDKEFRQLCLLMQGKTAMRIGPMEAFSGHIGGHDVLLCQCGVGKVNAAIGAVEAIRGFSPSLVVSTGVAGGAQTSLRVMDVVMSTECCYHDVYCGSECERGQVMGQKARFASYSPAGEITPPAGTSIVRGLIATGDWFVDSQEKMREILQSFPDAMAVDMESAAIAQVCGAYGVGFLSFRIISDVPLSDHKASQYYDFWDRLADGSFEVTRSLLAAL